MNKVIQIGRIATDIDVRTTQSGVNVATFRLAVNRAYTPKGGEKVSDFHACVAWRHTADFIARYCAKGDKIAVEGELQNRSYDAQDGSKRFVTEIIVNSVDLCGAKQSTQAQPERAQAPEPGDGFQDVDDDDLPF